ncbi:MAG: WXG100 family type VII secretion target [Armatimonadetes bacterium]|nr:WXG100 family type VII secretion target [Armatimonadota bacterium]
MPVEANPRELRDFAKFLEEKCGELRSRTSQVKGEFEGMRGVWTDAKYHQFARMFEQAMQEIDRFTKIGDKYSDYLERKAKPLEDYLRRSLR